MRRASIEDDDVARVAALQACREQAMEDSNDAKHCRSLELHLFPPSQPTRRASDGVESLKCKKDHEEWKASLGIPRTRHSWTDQYPSLANASSFHKSLAARSNSESFARSTQRIASQIDRILRDLDVSAHSTSNNSEMSADLILVPPVRRESWADEEDEGLQKGAPLRCVGGIHSW